MNGRPISSQQRKARSLRTIVSGDRLYAALVAVCRSTRETVRNNKLVSASVSRYNSFVIVNAGIERYWRSTWLVNFEDR